MVKTEEILRKYEKKIEAELNVSPKSVSYSKEYEKFKQEMIPEVSRYEKWAKTLGNIIKIKLAEKDRNRIQGYIDTAHLDITPSEVAVLGVISMLLIFLGTIAILFGLYFISGAHAENILAFGVLGTIASLFVFYYAFSMPQRKANEWRLKASSQMVPAILYIVVYMKHTSNLERAVEFASEHLEGPLALDFKKIFYDVEIGKFSTMKASLDGYLESWRDYAPEFIESFHLVESSLFEPSEARRVQILEKALQIILDGVYEKMLKYSREIRSPLTNIYMLGIVLPTLALALLPLATTLLGGAIQWFHVMIIFNVLIPFLVFYMTSEVLLKRPGGYGEGSVLELNPDYDKYKSNKPWAKAALIAIPLLILGILPFILQSDFVTGTLGIQKDYTFSELGLSTFGNMKIFDFKVVNGKTIGPFGPLGILLSLFIPLAIALFFSIAYRGKTAELMKSREKTKVLEEEFTNSLFQLGNRLGDGLPAEIAFGKVAEVTRGQETGKFFSLVNQNIQGQGMSLESAIFDRRRGAIIFFPSALIATSMKILVESVKKGLQVAAQSLMSISEYVKNIQKINQRLRDLLAEVVSDMSSNMTFLAPLLAGVIIGLSAMITTILNKLQGLMAQTGGTDMAGGFLNNVPKLFNIETMVPPYFMQVIIGVYIIEIIFILTGALVTVDSGKDTLREKYELSKNLMTGGLFYLGTALVAIVALSLLAAVVLGNML